jgi:YwiC-like protein
MLAVPLLLGVAACRPSPWHAVLAGAAVAGYLASATAQGWLRARRLRAQLAPLVTYALVFAGLGLLLAVAYPWLLGTTLVLLPAGATALLGAKPGTRRDLADSLAQVATAIVLVPAAALVSESAEVGRVALATVVAAIYLVGTVLVVRSVLRERGNRAFAALSIGAHAVVAVVAVVATLARALPWSYAALAVALTLRAVALPALQRRWAGGPHPLRPIHVGIVEIVSAACLVTLAFVSPM